MLKRIGLIGFADGIGSLIAILFWFYMAAVLSPEEYGNIFYYLGIVGIVSYFTIIGGQNAITVYTAKNINIQRTFYLLSLLLSSIAIVVIVTVFQRIDIALILLGYIISNLSISYLLGKKLFQKYLIQTLLQKSLLITLGIGFFYIFGTDGILYAIGISYLGYSKVLYDSFKTSKKDFKFFREHFGFIINDYLMGIINVGRSQIDKLIIAPLLGFALLGNYSLALQVVMGLTIFPNVIFKFLLPEEAEQKSNKKLKFFAIFTSPCISICGVVLTPVILPEIFPKYSDAVDAIRIMSLAVIPITLNLIFTSQLLGLEKSKFVLIGRLIALFTTSVLTITLGMSYGMIGLAIAFLLTSIVQTSVSAYANYNMKKDEESLST